MVCVFVCYVLFACVYACVVCDVLRHVEWCVCLLCFRTCAVVLLLALEFVVKKKGVCVFCLWVIV